MTKVVNSNSEDSTPMDHDQPSDQSDHGSQARRRWSDPEAVEFDVEVVTMDGPFDSPDAGFLS